ncbi:hypothetical protein Bbelb_274340 [Branchiostoma belcheri]|nr:hypothetical protein Bbelb_274340 [Branchiostoma belcheri]
MPGMMMTRGLHGLHGRAKLRSATTVRSSLQGVKHVTRYKCFRKRLSSLKALRTHDEARRLARANGPGISGSPIRRDGIELSLPPCEMDVSASHVREPVQLLLRYRSRQKDAFGSPRRSLDLPSSAAATDFKASLATLI